MKKINMTHTKKIFPYLTLAGAIPFVFCTLLLITNVSSLPDGIPVLAGYPTMMVVKVYGIVIASFMAGSHWGTHLHLISEKGYSSDTTKNTKIWSYYLPLISNLIAIGLWLAFITLSDSCFFIILISNFLLMLVVDWFLIKADIIQLDYFKIRCLITAIVVLSLTLAVFSI